MSYEQRVMSYQKARMSDILRHVSMWQLLRELYIRCEPVIVVLGLALIFTAALMEQI